MRVSGPVMNHNYSRTIQSAFGGIDNNPGAVDGSIQSMMNMTADYYPLLSTRDVSWQREEIERPGYLLRNVFAFDIYDGKTAFIELTDDDNVGLFYNNDLVAVLPMGPGERQMVRMGNLICIWPDMYAYDMRAAEAKNYQNRPIGSVPTPERYEGNIVRALDDEFDVRFYIFTEDDWHIFLPDFSMDARIFPDDATFTDGTYAGQPAERNTIKFSKEAAGEWTQNWRFKPGDALEIMGAENKANNKIAILREIDEDETYMYLRFDEGTFVNDASEDEIDIKRKVPELDFVCQHKNRIWGCRGKEIFCSHLGDPLNWYEYESLADGAWAVEIGSGELTGCVSYNYPLFFTENEIYTVLGNSPMEYTLSVTPNTYGLAKGSHKSFAIVKEYLFYHSPYGFCYYYGSMPQLCSAALGKEYYKEAVGGGKAAKYYVSCKSESGLTHNFVFDASKNIWTEEQNAWAEKISGYAWDGDLYAIMGDGIYSMGIPRHKPSDVSEFGSSEMPSQVVFNPWEMNSVNRKQVKSICIRHEVEGTLTAMLYVDGVLNDSLTKTITGKGMTEIVGIPRRGDNWQLVLSGSGAWRVYSIAYDYYEGTVKG